MNSLLKIFTILLIASSAQASPFMVSDPSSEAVGGIFEIWQGTGGLATDSQILSQCAIITSQDNQADGSVRYDLANIPAGTFHWYVRYGKSWGYYGSANTEVTGSMVYSSFVPFDFTRRSGVSQGPKNFRLVK